MSLARIECVERGLTELIVAHAELEDPERVRAVHDVGLAEIEPREEDDVHKLSHVVIERAGVVFLHVGIITALAHDCHYCVRSLCMKLRP